MEPVSLSTSHKDVFLDATKCIICQSKSDYATVSTANGRKRIREASDIRIDHVYKRIKLVNDDNFVYHMTNECYKTYTMKSVLDRLKSKNLSQSPNPSSSEQNAGYDKHARSQALHHPPTKDTTPTALREVICIICNNKSHKQQYTKFRICESGRAAAFLTATNFFQDAVFTRTCDLQDLYAVFGADLYYHKECMGKYLHHYESQRKTSKPKNSEKKLAWNMIAMELEQGLKNGKGYELSSIRDHLNKINDKCNFRNRDVKVFLLNQFGSEIDFTNHSAANKSMMVFSAPSTLLAEHIRSVDPINMCATLIKNTLNDYAFNLEDSFVMQKI